MTRKCFLLYLLMVMAIGLPRLAHAQKNDDYKAMAADVLRYVNKHRAKMHLKPLVMKEAISKQAEQHSRNMASRKTEFGHNGMDERVGRANKELNQRAGRWGENVASGQRTAEGVVADWLTSPGHKKNIEGDYTQTGIGIASNADGLLYFTQIFLRPRNGTSQ